jgi:hypothetical protein
MRFATEFRDLHLAAAGRALAEADIGGRKRLFADHLLRSVPLALIFIGCSTSGRVTRRLVPGSSPNWRTI